MALVFFFPLLSLEDDPPPSRSKIGQRCWAQITLEVGQRCWAWIMARGIGLDPQSMEGSRDENKRKDPVSLDPYTRAKMAKPAKS